MAKLKPMAFLRLIASETRREYFANKVKNMADSHSDISLKECDITTYWKDPSQFLIEAEFSVSKPLSIDIWKELFSQITKDYDISQDSDSFNFEHFESLETLKSKDLSCFAILNITYSSVKESQVNTEYEFKTEAGQALPTLKLNVDSILYTCIPDEPQDWDDEIEIWLDSRGEKICLFKNSLHYCLLGGSFDIERCEIRDDEANICFPKLFFDVSSRDRSWLNHLFADYKLNTTWLTKTPSGDMIIEIWEIDPYDDEVIWEKRDVFTFSYKDNPICEQRYSFTVSYNDFMEWWNQLMAMDTLR